MTYKERDKDGRVHKHQSKDRRPSITKAVGNRSSNKNTYKSTTLASLEESTLPSCGDGPAMALNVDTVMLLEGGKGDKVSIQEHIERLHNLEAQDVLGTVDLFVSC